MSYDSALDELLPHEIVVKHAGGRNIYGEVNVGGVAATYRARVLYEARQLTRPTGEEVVAAGKVWVSGTVPTAIATTDIITLPDGSTPELIQVDTFPDEEGLHHQVLWFR